MKHILVRSVFFFILATFSGLSAAGAASKAVITETKGKVEIKSAGSSSWLQAKVGMELRLNDTISTGFDAVATITIDQNILYVKSLSRLSLDKLISDGKKVSTTTFLRVGAVEASVNSAEGLTQDFRVQSPYSTASVRGTIFTYDGLKLKVNRGAVAFIPGPPRRESGIGTSASPGAGVSDGQEGEQGGEGPEDAGIEDAVLVSEGNEAIMEFSFTGEFQAPESSDSIESLRKETTIGGGEDFVPPPLNLPSTGSIRIQITLPEPEA